MMTSRPNVTITFVVTDHTPHEYLRYEGMTVDLPPDTLFPAGPGVFRGPDRARQPPGALRHLRAVHGLRVGLPRR